MASITHEKNINDLLRKGSPEMHWFGDPNDGPTIDKKATIEWFRTEGEWAAMIDELRDEGWDDKDLKQYLLTVTDPAFIGEDAWEDIARLFFKIKKHWIDDYDTYLEVVKHEVASDPNIKVGDWAFIYPVRYWSRPHYGFGRIGIGKDGKKQIVTDEGNDPSGQLPHWARKALAKQGTLYYPGQPRWKMTADGLRLVFGSSSESSGEREAQGSAREEEEAA